MAAILTIKFEARQLKAYNQTNHTEIYIADGTAMHKTIAFLIVLCLCWVSPFATSQPALSTICAADVVVNDHSEKNLQQALPQALNQVLVKVSGNTAVMSLPTIASQVAKVNHYVTSYSYTTQNDDPKKQTLVLHVLFDDKAIQQILQDAGQTIWGANRPLTLVWLTRPAGTQNTVLASDSNDPLMTTIKQTALSRGVPVIFPAMDLEDQTDVAQTTSALPTHEQLKQITKKYGVNSLLAGTIVNISSDEHANIAGEWRLVLNGASYEWQTTGNDITQVVNNGMDRAADMMVNQLAPIGGKNLQNMVTLQINDVQNLTDYVQVVAALKKLSPVSDVLVSDMNNNTLLLKVKTIGQMDELIDALKNTTNFIAVESVSPVSEKNPNLIYRFVSTDANSK